MCALNGRRKGRRRPRAVSRIARAWSARRTRSRPWGGARRVNSGGSRFWRVSSYTLISRIFFDLTRERRGGRAILCYQFRQLDFGHVATGASILARPDCPRIVPVLRSARSQWGGSLSCPQDISRWRLRDGGGLTINDMSRVSARAARSVQWRWRRGCECGQRFSAIGLRFSATFIADGSQRAQQPNLQTQGCALLRRPPKRGSV